WGRDLAFNRGQHNFDTLRYEYYGDASVIFEAFKAGELSFFRERSPVAWDTRYDFPAASRGEMVKSEIAHQRPSGMEGFVFNTRREPFKSWRVREAMILAFNFEFVNQTMNDSAYPRRTSYFANSELGMRSGPAEGRVRELLSEFDDLPPGTLSGYALPSADAGGTNRGNLRLARQLLAEAGWEIADDGVMRNQAGEPFEFTVMLRLSRNETIAGFYAEMLSRLGITMRIELVDNAQHVERRTAYDYDMMVNAWYLSLSPGNEQRLYWGSDGVETEGTRNYMGVESDVIDAMIDGMLEADAREDFVANVRALDRLLMAGRYVVPFWYSDVSLLAHRAEMRFPDRIPVYGDWQGFMPDVWWFEPG
ncbi:MAG: ABC transporter substrate-binding protein, partial [Pseudomonadota bacterium]